MHNLAYTTSVQDLSPHWGCRVLLSLWISRCNVFAYAWWYHHSNHLKLFFCDDWRMIIVNDKLLVLTLILDSFFVRTLRAVSLINQNAACVFFV